jgi:hypothetical protein
MPTTTVAVYNQGELGEDSDKRLERQGIAVLPVTYGEYLGDAATPAEIEEARAKWRRDYLHPRIDPAETGPVINNTSERNMRPLIEFGENASPAHYTEATLVLSEFYNHAPGAQVFTYRLPDETTSPDDGEQTFDACDRWAPGIWALPNFNPHGSTYQSWPMNDPDHTRQWMIDRHTSRTARWLENAKRLRDAWNPAAKIMVSAWYRYTPQDTPYAFLPVTAPNLANPSAYFDEFIEYQIAPYVGEVDIISVWGGDCDRSYRTSSRWGDIYRANNADLYEQNGAAWDDEEACRAYEWQLREAYVETVARYVEQTQRGA